MRSLFKAITVTTLSSTLVATLSACQTTHPPIATAPRVDLARFMGHWYVIANIPTFIERGANNAVESYRLGQAGTIAHEHYGLTEIIGPGIVSECENKNCILMRIIFIRSSLILKLEKYLNLEMMGN